jgi:nucleoside-diphosphate-sugar epimerase
MEKVTYLSSSMVFESTTWWPSKEGDERQSPPPLSSYGFQKLSVEYFAHAAWDQHQLPYTSFVAGLCMAELRFFDFDAHSWMLGEPHDWNLCRRMMEAGVRIGWVDQVLAKVYPTGPRGDVEQT